MTSVIRPERAISSYQIKQSCSFKFVADRTLGKLVKSLRLLGFDTVYCNELDNHTLSDMTKEGRTVLTRDTKLARRCPQVILIDDNDPDDQLKHLVGLLGLTLEPRLFFSRCVYCNDKVKPVEKSRIRERVPDYVWSTHRFFSKCSSCRRIYWKGSHFHRFKEKLGRMIG